MSVTDQKASAGRHALGRKVSAPEGASAVPLDRLAQGDGGVISRIEAAEADLQRMQVMGICPGRWVHIVKPGDPMIVRVLGTRIGLAAALATFVCVESSK